jgi:hypothetical protein
MIKDVKLDYDFSVFLKAEYKNASSCSTHQVHELKDIHDNFGGFPDTYVFENTKIYQLWFDDKQVDYKELGSQLGIEVVTVSSIMQPPGCTIPWHRDTFYQINKRFPEDKRLKVRANMFLEDRKIGHYIEYDNIVVADWKQGDGLLWDSNVLHLGANCGMENKYTLQVSGFYV